MIRFFRKLRQRLFKGNPPDQAGRAGKFNKYLLYAIGEILLVVIGILIALQVNNWNEYRAERKQERVILHQLKIEFTSNLDQLNGKIIGKEKLIRSVKRLFHYIDHPELAEKDSIDFHLGWTIPFTTFDPIENDLASSGSLRLIRSDSLKLMLSLWTANIKEVQEDDLSWKWYRDNLYSPFLVEQYQLRNIRDMADKSGLWDRFLIGAGEEAKQNMNEGVGPSVHEVDVNRLLAHPDFEDHLERAISMNRFALEQSLILRERIREILEMVDAELARF